MILSHVTKLAKLYIFWTIVYMPLTVYNYIKNDYSITYSLLDFARGFMLLGEHYNSYILWYILSSIYALLFIWLLMRRNWQFKTIVMACNILMIFGFIFTELVTIEDSLHAPLAIPTKILWVLLGPRGRIFMGFGYISIGMLIAQHDKYFGFWRYIALIIGFAGAVFSDGFEKSLSFVCLSVPLFLLIKDIEHKNNELYLICRSCSTVMYFLHLWIWTIYYSLIYSEKTYGSDCFVVTTLICLTIGIAYHLYKTKSFSQKIKDETKILKA